MKNKGKGDMGRYRSGTTPNHSAGSRSVPCKIGGKTGSMSSKKDAKKNYGKGK